MPQQRGPMPTVTYDGKTYKVKGRNTEIPDLEAMERMGALCWLCANTYGRGYSRDTNPLRGLGGVISVTVR